MDNFDPVRRASIDGVRSAEDADDGELRPEIIVELTRSLEEAKAGKRGTPIRELALELGLEWDE